MDAVAQHSPAMEMEEDCFLTMARSIVDEILARHGVELACDAESESARSREGYPAAA